MSATKTAEAVHANLAAALAAVQTEIPSVAKGAEAKVQTKTGGEYKYKYADLAVITPLILPLLGKNGLAFSAQPTMVGDAFVLHYTLAHESGEAIEGIYPLPDPTVGKPQEIGSAITYARRYALCAVTGVAPGGDDDDAASANERPAAARKPRRQRQQAVQEPPAPAVATQNWAAQILDVNSIDELRAVHGAAESGGELGMQFAEEHGRFVAEVASHFSLTQPPRSVTVAQLINAVRGALAAPKPEAADETPEQTPAAPGTAAEWETATIPNGDES